MPELLLNCRVRKLTGHWGALSFRDTLCSLRMVLDWVGREGGERERGREGKREGKGEREKGERGKEREREGGRVKGVRRGREREG